MAELILVRHSDGRAVFLKLVLTTKLQEARIDLVFRGYMTKDDSFIFDRNAVAETEEETVTLNEIIQKNKDDRKEIVIGDPSVNAREPDIDLKEPIRFQNLSYNEKRDLLGENNLNIYQGLTFKSGNTSLNFVATHQSLYKFPAGYIPKARNPDLEIDSEDFLSFSQETHSLHISGTSTSSLSLSTPYVDAEAEYKKSKEESHSSDKINSYFTQRYLRKKVDLSTDIKKIIVERSFIDAIRGAVNGLGLTRQACLNLIKVLNEYGWYVPLEYTLGGAVFATETKEITTLENAYKESESFKASFKATVGGYSGGGSHEEEHSKEEKDKNVKKLEKVTLQVKGGSETAKPGDFTDWNKSLNEPINWRVISYDKLLPSLMLLSGIENDMMSTCLGLLRQFSPFKEIKEEQPHINIKNYELDIAEKLAPIYD